MPKRGEFNPHVVNSDRAKQVRIRLRRGTLDPEVGRRLLGGKPLEEWDLDELAKGKPRRPDGTFSGSDPAWLTAEMKEEAHRRFVEFVRGEMSRGSIKAIRRVAALIDEGESDRVQLDASKFLLEHLVGKPTQEVTGGITMNLQAVLAQMLVNPDGEEALPEIEDAEVFDDMEDDDDF